MGLAADLCVVMDNHLVRSLTSFRVAFWIAMVDISISNWLSWMNVAMVCLPMGGMAAQWLTA